jgi:TfoX/Sxy family transcriptional regulator of competence genes
MFGGITFLLDGNMLCCASRKGLMVRVGAAAESRALESPHASPCLGAGRRMPGFLIIEPSGLATESDLARWIRLARAYVETLPPKLDKKRDHHSSSSTVTKSTRNRKTGGKS